MEKWWRWKLVQITWEQTWQQRSSLPFTLVTSNYDCWLPNHCLVCFADLDLIKYLCFPWNCSCPTILNHAVNMLQCLFCLTQAANGLAPSVVAWFAKDYMGVKMGKYTWWMQHTGTVDLLQQIARIIIKCV